MGFPSRSELKRVLKKLKNVEGSYIPGPDATVLELFRFEICQRILKYKMARKITQKELAKIMGVDEAKISKILHYRVDEFSTDRLIELYTRIEPNLKLMIG